MIVARCHLARATSSSSFRSFLLLSDSLISFVVLRH